LRFPLRSLAVAGGCVLVLGSARDAAAACQNGSSTQAITTSSNPSLYSVLGSSSAPCVISVAPGTYTPPAANIEFAIANGITVRATGGPGTTVLQTAGAPFTSVAIWPVNGSCPSGATLDGFTVNGGATGVFVGALAAAGHAGCAVTDVTLRNLTVNTNQAPGHGIQFNSVRNSVIDSCTVNSSGGNGILLYQGANNNIVMNNRVAGAVVQMAIALQTSDDNVIVGNTSVASAFDGIFLNSMVGLSGPGSSRNRIERNNISGHRIDGIVVNDASGSNYVGLNTTVSASYVPGSSVEPPPGGTGIWVNNASNGNYLFGNDVSGSPENGIDVLASKSTLLVANSVHGNYQGGIWVADVRFAAAETAPAPQDTVLHGNRSFFNTANAMIFLQGAINSEAAYNYLSGAQGQTLASNMTTAFRVQDSSTARVFENTVSEVGARAIVDGTTANATFFRNRFLKGTNIPNPPQIDGRNGVTYTRPSQFVQWDGGSFLGGNHWSEFTIASGNPDPTHPYSAFIGTNVDRFPFQWEMLQTSQLANSLVVVEPVAGAVLAAGTRKTIRWVARGCALVDIYYGSGALSPSLIAAGYPNTGYYFWSVPSVALRSDYYVQLGCADSNDVSLGLATNSPSFTVAASDLVLMNPGRGTRAVNGSTLRVAWKKSAAVGAVDIYVRSGSGAETKVATAAAGETFRDIALPATVSSSSRVSVRIQDGATSRQDSVDGYFMVRGGSPSFTSALGGLTLQVGSIRMLEWTGTSGSYAVDLDLLGGTTISIARNLPDFGTYTWFVPDASAQGVTLRATFKNESGVVVGVVDSGLFNIARDGTTGPPAPGGAASRRDFDGDSKTDVAIFRPSDGTWWIRYSSRGYATSGYGYFQWGLPGDIPMSGDFDGDNAIELTVFRPSDGTWWIRYPARGDTPIAYDSYQWGLPDDVPIAGDFDGDGKTDLTVYRPSDGTWWIRYPSRGDTPIAYNAFQWGQPGDIPITADFDGDGKTDLTVYRPSDGTWWIRYPARGDTPIAYDSFQWGAAGDIPIAGDFDGDGRADLTVYRPSDGTWWILYAFRSGGALTYDSFQWGHPGDIPLARDFDGDGKTELTVYRPSDGTWWIQYPARGYDASSYDFYQWGLSSDETIK
jgi:parallel beta-helix repeat protein